MFVRHAIFFVSTTEVPRFSCLTVFPLKVKSILEVNFNFRFTSLIHECLGFDVPYTTDICLITSLTAIFIFIQKKKMVHIFVIIVTVIFSLCSHILVSAMAAGLLHPCWSQSKSILSARSQKKRTRQFLVLYSLPFNCNVFLWTARGQCSTAYNSVDLRLVCQGCVFLSMVLTDS